MKEKEIRLNAEKRKSLNIDFRRHCESLDTEEKEAFKQSRDDAKSTIDSSFATCKEVVQRRFKPEHIFGDRSLKFYEQVHNSVKSNEFHSKVNKQSNSKENYSKIHKSIKTKPINK